MTTTLASFSYEGRAPLRVFGSPEEPLFIAREVCAALGISAHRDALQRVPEWAQGRPLRVDTPGTETALAQRPIYGGSLLPTTHEHFIADALIVIIAALALNLSCGRDDR